MKPGNDELTLQLSKLSRKEMMKSSLLQNQGIINRFLWPEFHCHMLLWIQNICFSVLNLIRSPAIYFPDLNLDQNACRSIKSCPFPWLYFFRQLRILIENYFTSCKLWTLKVSKKLTSSPMMGVPSSKKPTKFCLFLWPLCIVKELTVLWFTRQNYDQSSAVAVYEEFRNRISIYIFFFRLRDVAHGLMTYRYFLVSEFWSEKQIIISRTFRLTTRLSNLRVIKIKR